MIPRRPLRVALTGGIATGKSYVLDRLATRGVHTVDADRVARDVVRRGAPAWDAVRRRFGASILQPDDEVDRGKLARIVFADATARNDLESIVHPEVYDAIEHWFSDLMAVGATLGVADIPLLFETQREHDFDRVVVVACPPDVQVTRLRDRDGLTQEEAHSRLAAQDPIEEKTARAHHVVRTDGTYADTNRQIDDVLDRLRDTAG